VKIGDLNIFKWTCKNCNDYYSQNLKPYYNCFCGNYYENQKYNKEFNDLIIPHSCGCPCGYLIDKNKKCNLPCHPGPHKYIEDLNIDTLFKNDDALLFIEDNNLNNKIINDNLSQKKSDNFLKTNNLNNKDNSYKIDKNFLYENQIINLKGKIHIYGPNCEKVKEIVYCGRQNYLGGWKLDKSIRANPFKVSEYKTNEEACKKFEEYLRSNKTLLEALPTLIGKKLACWCYPNPCRTEIILKLMKEKNYV